MSAWNWQLSNGRLILLPWSFTKSDSDYSNSPSSTDWRTEIVAEKIINSTRLVLRAGRYTKAWYLSGSGHGFAGASSKHINPICTRSLKIFEAWKAAIETGNVEILERHQ